MVTTPKEVAAGRDRSPLEAVPTARIQDVLREAARLHQPDPHTPSRRRPGGLGWALGNALKEGCLFLTPPGKNPRFLLGEWGWGGVREGED